MAKINFYNLKICLRNRIDLLKKRFKNIYLLDFENFKNSGDQYLKLFFKHEFDLGLKSWKKLKNEKNCGVSGKKLEALRKVNRYHNKFSKKVKKILRRLGLSPRNVFQNKLSYWKAEEPITQLKTKEKINDSFSDDWKYFKSVKYVPKAEQY